MSDDHVHEILVHMLHADTTIQRHDHVHIIISLWLQLQYVDGDDNISQLVEHDTISEFQSIAEHGTFVHQLIQSQFQLYGFHIELWLTIDEFHWLQRFWGVLNNVIQLSLQHTQLIKILFAEQLGSVHQLTHVQFHVKVDQVPLLRKFIDVHSQQRSVGSAVRSCQLLHQHCQLIDVLLAEQLTLDHQLNQLQSHVKVDQVPLFRKFNVLPTKQ